ncbi:uncharacterized protein LOC113552131 [Rhopalosiphum maidis]|uniref:uncharacterized protein LOC113552131 n=1 Tax=Rhopalosiphum maidis TaxID=43146 RepID=UPI000EFF33D6|nr:uncharacterized protein LOC113552131 [Rhopalosiphum maidis]
MFKIFIFFCRFFQSDSLTYLSYYFFKFTFNMSALNDDAIALVGLALILKNKKQKKREKRTKDWLLKRKTYSHVNLLNELRFQPLDFKNYLRMDEDTYRNLLSMVAPLIQKQDTVMRKSISPHERLAVTLRFLTTGRTYEYLKYTLVISSQALGKIIPETCDALYRVLRKEYLRFPTTEKEWKDIAQLFEGRWNIPHCIGALDGKHINIVPPAGSGSEFFNYKGHHSMVLLGLVNANYQFLLADFGTNGRHSDGGVLQNTTFFEKLLNEELNIPFADNIE